MELQEIIPPQKQLMIWKDLSESTILASRFESMGRPWSLDTERISLESIDIMTMEDGNEDQLKLRAVYLGLLVYGDQQVRRVVTILTEVIKHVSQRR